MFPPKSPEFGAPGRLNGTQNPHRQSLLQAKPGKLLASSDSEATAQTPKTSKTMPRNLLGRKKLHGFSTTGHDYFHSRAMTILEEGAKQKFKNLNEDLD